MKLVLVYFRQPAREIVRWLVRSKETTNLTYDLTPLNQAHLAAFVSAVTGAELADCERYLDEIKNNSELAEHVRRKVLEGPHGDVADADARYGRRIGWYAIVRATKPTVVVETGVDKGLGSCVLAAAILRNRQDGTDGRYYGTDIDPAAGYLLDGPYAAAGEILYGDSIDSLGRLSDPIDLFINDSDHSQDYEAREYVAVAHKLSPEAIILGDNSHVSPALSDFARRTGRRFLFFREQPADHWYPGAGIGAAYPG